MAKNNHRVFAVLFLAALIAGILAFIGVKPAEAAFPGTNGKIIFDSDRLAAVGGPGLYTIIPGGTATKIPGTSPGDNQPAWSPDGSRIAFQSGSATSQEISVMNADGSGRRQLTTTTTVAEQEPTWSPDGSQIAFVMGDSSTDTTTDLEIWVMNADGSGLTQLTNTLQSIRDTHPAWSPNGNQIAFLSEGRPGDTNSNIYVMDTDPATDDATNLTPNTTDPVYQANDEDPSWSPDGTQIAYSTIADVWKINANGTGRTNLTGGSGGGQNPAWSPDGNSIVYVSSGDIYVMDADDGGNKTAVDTTPRQDVKPDWQPVPVCTARVNPDNDRLVGTAGKDVLCGDNRDNIINGGGGNDIIVARGGNDKLTGALGNDTINGGPGKDTALYSGSTRVVANLTTEFAKGVGMDVQLGIENLSGSNVKDTLTGTASTANVLNGLGGNDVLSVKDDTGGDTANGGTGTDTCRRDAGDVLKSCP